MYRILEGRGTGKTSRLMLLAKENNGTIICSNPNAMRTKAHAYGITGIDFISYSDFFQTANTDIGPYYIDELESFVKHYAWYNTIHGNFDGYTLTTED